MTKLNVYKTRLKMYRLFTNSGLLSKMGECNIYYISINIYILYLGLENTTLSNQNFIPNKKIYTLMFFSGNSGNSGNKPLKSLKYNNMCVTKNTEICYHCYHFSFWQQKLDTLFFNDFLEKPKYYRNAYFLCIFTLILVVINKLQQYHRNVMLFSYLGLHLKPPNMIAYFSKILLFFVCRRKFL